jgi:Flp pilus assembly protein TadD
MMQTVAPAAPDQSAAAPKRRKLLCAGAGIGLVALAVGWAVGSLTTSTSAPTSTRGAPSLAAPGLAPASDPATKLLNIGIAQAQSKQYQQAATTFHDVLLLDPGSKYAWYDLGVIAQDHSQTVAAITDYAKAISIDPRFTPAMYNQAILLERAHPRVALAMYQRITMINPRASTAFMHEGWVYDRLGETGRAAESHARAIALDPRLASVPTPGNR